MISLYFGKDTYTSKHALKELVTEHIKKHQEINFVSIDGEDLSSTQSIVTELTTIPFLSTSRMIVVNNLLSGNKKSTFKNEYVEYLKKSDISKSKEYILIHYESTNEIDKRQSLFKYLQKEATVHEYTAPNDKQAMTWIQNRLKEHHLSITPDALSEIINNYESLDYWQLSSDIEKLILLSKAHTVKEIDVDMVRNCITRGVTSQVFDLTDYIANKNREKALFILMRLLESGENEFLLLSTLSYQIRTLLTLKLLLEKKLSPSDIIKISKLHPFVVNKNRKQTEKFTKEELIGLMKALTETEYAMKSKEVDTQLMLIDLVNQCTV